MLQSLLIQQSKTTGTKSSDIDGLGFDNIDDLDILNENLVEPKAYRERRNVKKYF